MQQLSLGRSLPAVFEAPAVCQCRGTGLMAVGSPFRPLGHVVCSGPAGRAVAIKMAHGRQPTRR